MERILDSDEDGRDIADDERKVQRLYDYLEYLTQMAQIAFIETRADAVAIEMRGAFKNLDPDPIEVFSVSAGRYMDWMKAHQQTRPVLSPEMTGIPGLRKLLLSIAADRNWEAYRHHTFSKLPSLNKKISRITDENKKDDAYAIIRPDFGKQVAECKTRQLNAFRNFIEKGIPDVWTDAGIKDQKYRDINEIVKGWHKGLGWKTYDKAVRENGIVLKTKSAKFKTDGAQFNWNEDIGEEIYDQMGSWKKRMDQAVAEFAEEFGNITAEACEKISRSISESSLVPQLKDIAIEDWGEREEAVIEHSAELEGILGEEVDAIYEYATTETDIRCMIARANREIFEKAAQGPRGKGMYQAQQQTIKTKFRRRDEHGDNIVERLEKTVLERTKENLDYSFAEFLQAHIDEFELFEEQIGDRLPADYEMTPHDRQIRVALRYMLPDLHESIEKVQAHFDPDKNSGHSTSSEIGPPPKKQKVDHCSGTKATEIETPQWLSYWGSIFGPGSSNTA